MKYVIPVSECVITKNKCGLSYFFASFQWLQNFVRNRESSIQILSSGRGRNGKSHFYSYLKPGLPFWVFHITHLCCLSLGLICVFLFVRQTYPSVVEQNVVVYEAVMKMEE